MFLKLLGLIIVMITSTSIGYKLAQKLDGRLKDLRDIQLLLQILEREVAFMANSLPQALITASKAGGNADVIFRECGELLKSKNGYCIEDAWESAVNKFSSNTFLIDDDRQILLKLGKSLGSYDIQNQTNSIKLISSQLAIQEKNAEEVVSKNSKMYKSLGFLCGVAIVVILL